MDRNVRKNEALLRNISPDVIEILTVVRQLIDVVISFHQNFPTQQARKRFVKSFPIHRYIAKNVNSILRMNNVIVIPDHLLRHFLCICPRSKFRSIWSEEIANSLVKEVRICIQPTSTAHRE